MAQELFVVLRRSETLGLGFSLLGTADLPPVICDVIENSPAAQSGEVEAGDIILKINEVDVKRFSIKEVLKCLRLSADPVVLKLKRDPEIKKKICQYLNSVHETECSDEHCNSSSESEESRNGTCSELQSLLPKEWESSTASEKCTQPHTPRFEAYMMTGDLIINLSRTQHSSGVSTKYHKKFDVLKCSHHHHHHHHNHHNNHHSSVPTSPNEMELGCRAHRHKSSSPPDSTTSAGTSPVGPMKTSAAVPCLPGPSYPFVRTSRSEDRLQLQKDSSLTAVDIDIDEDVTSSLNTLLDTRHDVGGNTTEGERIVWTYNAPLSSPSNSDTSCCISSDGASPQHSLSPASPTSVSSSVMSSNSGSKKLCVQVSDTRIQPNGDLSQSEAISNISSPDYQEAEALDILSARDFLMDVSDPSDSDSTLLVSDQGPKVNAHSEKTTNSTTVPVPQDLSEYRIVIQVKGPGSETSQNMTPTSSRGNFRMPNSGTTKEHGEVSPSKSPSFLSSGNVTPEYCGYQELRESEDELPVLNDDSTTLAIATGKDVTPPPSSEDESDIESLHSFHYSPKAVDIPSAIRLAKRLYMLDGFKKSDVSRHLSKNNDFSRAVAEEYLKYFSFEGDTLDVALRKFLKQFSLMGETQERERVLVHFSNRYLDCNPGAFNSQDAVHTLTCAIMLLNTDLHGQNIGRKMTCSEFIDNLSELNDGENFPRDVLKQLYQAIKSYPLEWALDEDGDDNNSQLTIKQQLENQQCLSSSNPFLEIPNAATAVEYKKGYVMRKCCMDANGKRTPFGKRGWKMFYCTLRDMVLYLHKDEHGFRKGGLGDNFLNAIRIHHALATKATDYTKKQHVFRLQTADQAEYLFQTSDSKELQSWIDTINVVCATFSAQPLAGAVGSRRKFQRPLLPCSHTKFSVREQLQDHEERVENLEAELNDHRQHPPDRNAKSLNIQNYKEKETYLQYEVKRYKTYAYLLRSRLTQYGESDNLLTETSIGEEESGLVPPPVPDRRISPPTNS